MTFIKLLLADFKRGIFSRRGAFAVFGLLLLGFLSILDEMRFYSNEDISYYVFFADYINTEFFFVIFAAVPSATLFCVDIESDFYRFVLTRTTPLRYGFAKVITCLVSSVFVVLASDYLYMSLLALKYPIVRDGDMATVLAYMEYYLIKSIIKGLFAAVLAVAAMLVSIKITNAFVVLATPLLLYNLVNLLTNILKLPSWLNIRYLMQMNIHLFEDGWKNNLYTVFFFMGLVAVMGVFFAFGARRRFRNA